MFKELGFLILTLLFSFRATHGLETIHAANFNGKDHTDSLGITYKAVTLKNPVQYSETYPNVPKADYSLYQTIAYDKKLNYTIPVNGSGHYLLIVKFVAWNSWSASFNMLLNGQHSVRSNFTWYDSSSKYDVAYDHYIYFSVCDDTLQYINEESVIKNNQIQISIWSPVGFYTSMSAVAVLKGEIDQVPVVPTAQIYSDADLWQTFDHACHEFETTTGSVPETTTPEPTPSESTTPTTPQWSTTSPWTTTSRPENTTSTTWPPTSTSTTSRPPTTTPTTPRPPTTPPPTTPPPTPPTPPKPAPGQVQVVNIFNTFINSLVKNYNFNYIVRKRDRSVGLPDGMSDFEKLDNMIQE